MSGNRDCTVYIGNLDEKVGERVLYDIMIQAGRVVELYVPRDKETDKPKGYAFAEYETEEIANYAVRLFSGLVTLYNRPLKFAISGQDKSSSNNNTGGATTSNPFQSSGPNRRQSNGADIAQNSTGVAIPCKDSAFSNSRSQASFRPGVTRERDGHGSRSNGSSYDYSRRAFGSAIESISRSRSHRYDTSNPVPYPSY